MANDPQLPGLVLGIEVATEVVRVGDPITITLFLINRAAAPADDLVLTLPVPDGARALTDGKPTPQLRSWSWNLGTLPGQQSVSVTATLQLTRMPQGEALLLTPEATARGLAAPVRAEGGALVDERVPQALPQGDGGDSVAPATTIATPAEEPPTPFLPGKPVVLRSPRGRVSIRVPGDASKQPLQLRYRFADAVLPELLAARQPLPPAEPNRRRSLGIFFLDARDDQGRAVHQFERPLTFSIGYTDAQLRVLGINPGALRLFWFDPARSRAQPDGSTRLGAWVPVEATLDVVARTMTAQVDHFSAFAPGNGNSPSSTYLPSLQGWQVSDYTGAASFAYPFDVPAGPGGLTPSLALSYSSNAPDGPGGVGEKLQASWVGRGWSLDPGGAIARNKNPCCSDYDSFTLTAMGRSFDFVRGNPIAGSTNIYDLSAWAWHTVDESYWKITAGANDTWTVWAPDGTRYDYTRPLRWGWKGAPGQSDTYETYKWLLTAVVDPSGNKITFAYETDPWNPYGQVINPTSRLTTISWGYDGTTPGTGTARYQLDFAAQSRWLGYTAGVDGEWDYAANQVGTRPKDAYPDYGKGAPHDMYRLDSITLSSLVPGEGMRAVRAWTLSYATAAASVRSDAYNEGTGAPNGQPMLTLLGIQQRGATKSTTPVWSYLPATTFTYGVSRGTGLAPTPGWNRLLSADNGYGGRTTYTYQHVWAPPGSSDGTALPSGEGYYEGSAYAYRFRVRSMLQQGSLGTGVKEAIFSGQADAKG